MLGTTLNRMIFWELVRVFLLSLGTLTSLFLIAGVVDQASKQGLSIGQIVRIIPLMIPSMLPLTIPATTLFASCVVYGRLAHDNEVIALKAAGVHLFGIVKPALLLGLITTGTTLYLSHSVIPNTQRLLYVQVLSDPEEVIYNMLRRDRCLRHPNQPYVVYVRDVQGKRLIDVVIKQREKAEDKTTGATVYTGYGLVFRTPEAQIRVDRDAGVMTIVSHHFVIYDKAAIGTTTQAGPITRPLPDSVSGKDAMQKISVIPWDQLPRRIAQVEAELADVLRQRRQTQAAIDQIENPQLRTVLQNEMRNYQYQIDMKSRHIRNLKAEIHMRPAMAVSCLVFALIGCPVGIWANRADYLSTFVMCFLPTLVVYYPLLLAGADLGKNGRIPIAVGCWLADIVVGLLAMLLMWRLLRR